MITVPVEVGRISIENYNANDNTRRLMQKWEVYRLIILKKN